VCAYITLYYTVCVFIASTFVHLLLAKVSWNESFHWSVVFLSLSVNALQVTIQQQSSPKLYTQAGNGFSRNWLGFQCHGVKGQGHTVTTIHQSSERRSSQIAQ